MSVHSLTLRGTPWSSRMSPRLSPRSWGCRPCRPVQGGPGALRRSLARTELVLANLTTVIGRQLAPGDLPSVLACWSVSSHIARTICSSTA